VQFVNVEDLLKGNDPQALNDALSKNKDGVDALQSALGSNPALGLLLASSDTAAAKVTPPAAGAHAGHGQAVGQGYRGGRCQRGQQGHPVLLEEAVTEHDPSPSDRNRQRHREIKNQTGRSYERPVFFV
jgi:hypothetical protein